MKEVLQYVSLAVGLVLNLLVISALLRGAYREYVFAFIYAVALLLTTVVESSVYFLPGRPNLHTFYWADEIILDVLVYSLVISFIDRASREAKRRTIERRWLILLAVGVAVVSYARNRAIPNPDRMMTAVSRDLNICAVVLDLILWSLLVAVRRPNRRLLLLSGGLGVQLTGAIIGESIREISKAAVNAGIAVEVITGFLGLYIWWRAFSPNYGTVGVLKPIKKGGSA